MGDATGNPPARAALYVRVSTDEQARHNTSIGSQVDQLVERAEREGWEIAGSFVDDGYSGYSSTRPALEKVRGLIRKGEIDVVAAIRQDRLVRRTRLLLEIIEDELLPAGVRLVLLNSPIEPTSPLGLKILTNQAAEDEYERARILERMEEGQAARAAEGRWPGGVPPFGYTTVPGEDGRGSVGKIVDDEARVVRRIYALVVQQGCTTGETAKVLNREGFRMREGSLWGRQAVQRMIRHADVWAGKYTFGEWTIDVDPILKTLEAQALKRVAAETALGPRTRKREYLLSRRIVSPHGETMHGFQTGDRPPQYRCNHAVQSTRPPGVDRCDCRPVRADKTETLIWDAVTEILSDPDRMARLAEEIHQARAGVAVNEKASLEDKYEDRARAVADRTSEYQKLKARYGVDDALDMISDTDAKIAELDADIERLERFATKGQEAEGLAANLRTLAEEARDVLVATHHSTRSRILQLMDLQVVVTGWETCDHCNGKGRLGLPPLSDGKKRPRGDNQYNCPQCHALRVRPHFALEGTVTEALLNAVAGGGQVINLHGMAVPFAVEVANDAEVA